MAYLDVPRLHFSGRFFADPSTIDNNSNNFRPNPPLSNDPNDPLSVFRNQIGSHAYEFRDCVVRTGIDNNGKAVAVAAVDPLIGARCETILERYKYVAKARRSGRRSAEPFADLWLADSRRHSRSQACRQVPGVGRRHHAGHGICRHVVSLARRRRHSCVQCRLSGDLDRYRLAERIRLAAAGPAQTSQSAGAVDSPRGG